MGSVGTNRGTVISTSLKGQSTAVLDKYTSWDEGSKNIRKDFNLDFATESQINAIRDIFKGIREYDKGYDENKTPYTIEDIKIERLSQQTPEELQRNKELFGRTMERKDIMVSITTIPQSESALIRMMDEKYRFTLIGKGGGYYTYNDNHKRTSISSFDIMYGSRGNK